MGDIDPYEREEARMRRRVVGLAMLCAATSLTVGCSSTQVGAHTVAPRGHQVTAVKSSTCGYRVVADAGSSDLTLPAISAIWVGCGKITAPKDVAYYLGLVSARDDRKQSCPPLAWGVTPTVLGVAADGKYWSIHMPVNECGVPKEPAADVTFTLWQKRHLTRPN